MTDQSLERALGPCRQCGYSAPPRKIVFQERKHFHGHAHQCQRCLFHSEAGGTWTEAAEKWNAPREPRKNADGLINRLFSFCDASNWDSDCKRGDYYRGWKDATDEVHEIASDFQDTRAAVPEDRAAGGVTKPFCSDAQNGGAVCDGVGRATSAPEAGGGLIERAEKAEALMIEWRSLAQEMTPGGSEFMSPGAVRAHYLDFKRRYHEAKCNEARLRKELAALIEPDALFAFLTKKYVQRSDDRQKAMGLQYMTAETHDLAEEIARFLAALSPRPATDGDR